VVRRADPICGHRRGPDRSRHKDSAGCPPLVFAILACLPAAAADNGGSFQQEIEWRDNFTTRLEALALLQSLNVDLLSQDSATLTLDRWCRTHRLATPAEIVADRVPGVEKAPTAEQRQILRVTESEPVQYRRVRLRCGTHVLSEAENWYVPSRLTPEMNKALDTTSIPFGRAVQALHFRRQILSAKLLWSPLPEGWEMGAASGPAGSSSTTLQIPSEVLQHRAVLTLLDGTPFSTVIETYTDDVLAFPEPATSKSETP
jgi:chorismate-pyruvate lyase